MRPIPQSLICLHSMAVERFSASFFVARPSRLIHGACVLKIPSLIAAALALLASFCSQAFIDRHSSPGASTESPSAAGCPARLDGLLQHIWLAEQIQAERMQLARLRAEREALEMWLQTQKTARRSAQGTRAPDRPANREPILFAACRCVCAGRPWWGRIGRLSAHIAGPG